MSAYVSCINERRISIRLSLMRIFAHYLAYRGIIGLLSDYVDRRKGVGFS